MFPSPEFRSSVQPPFEVILQVVDEEESFCSEISVQLPKDVSCMKASMVSFTETPLTLDWIDVWKTIFVILESKCYSKFEKYLEDL